MAAPAKQLSEHAKVRSGAPGTLRRSPTSPLLELPETSVEALTAAWYCREAAQHADANPPLDWIQRLRRRATEIVKHEHIAATMQKRVEVSRAL